MDIALKNISFYEKEGVMSHKRGNWEVLFYNTVGSLAKMYVQVWMYEGKKKYLKDEKTIGWRITKDVKIDEQRTKLFEDTLTNFISKYFHEKNIQKGSND